MDVSRCAHQVGERAWAGSLSAAAQRARESSGMNDRPDVKYLPCYCQLVQREVWAILAQQADGSWPMVNCLDKDEVCFQLPCVFTVDGGQWPFEKTPRLKDTQPLR